MKDVDQVKSQPIPLQPLSNSPPSRWAHLEIYHHTLRRATNIFPKLLISQYKHPPALLIRPLCHPCTCFTTLRLHEKENGRGCPSLDAKCDVKQKREVEGVISYLVKPSYNVRPATKVLKISKTPDRAKEMSWLKRRAKPDSISKFQLFVARRTVRTLAPEAVSDQSAMCNKCVKGRKGEL